jgi:GDP-fucose transporter C1
MQAPSTQTLQVAGVVLFYMTAALVMVFVNKAVLNGSPDIPVLFLLIQVVLAVVLLQVSAFFSKRVELPKVDIDTAKKLLPVILVNGIGLIFNTLCLREVEATFYQIARGMVLPLTILVSTIDTHVVPSWRVLIAASVVVFGFLVGVAPDPSVPVRSAPSLLSLFYGLLSALFIALHAVLIKRSLSYCNNSTIQLAWWTNAGTAVFFVPFVILQGEPSVFLERMRNPEWNGIAFMWGCLVTGFFGFLLSIAGLLSVKITSPITHMFSSAARSVVQTILGVLIFNDLINVSRATSIFVILLGTIFYTWVKHSDGANKPPANQNDVEAIKLRSKDEQDDTVIWQHEEQEEKERIS